MLTPTTSPQNHLLAVLPAAEYERVAAGLDLVEMPLGKVLSESGGHMRYVYFPTTCVVSIMYVLADGSTAEIGVVGNEGIVGISLFMGGETTPSRSVVRGAGQAYRLDAALLQAEFNRGGAMIRLLLRYTQSLLTQMAQTAVCNRHHSVEQQLCRALLLTLDRTTGSSLSLTQEMIAGVLGVRREGVTEAAGHLQNSGLIQYRRGHIDVLDRTGLEAAVCECYGVVKAEYERLMDDIPRVAPETPVGGEARREP